jgi:ribosomal protein S18 acetylase RimI-like enzyme
MSHRSIPVPELSAAQITDLARLHHQVMHSLLTDLGLPVVERYYRIACKDPAVIGFATLSETGKLLGWAIGSSKPEQLNGRLREAPVWLITQMLRVLFTRPRVIGQLIASVHAAASSVPDGAIELTYIGVDASARKQGVGRAVLGDFLLAARGARYRAVVLSVEAENESAIALYTKAGFTLTDTFTEGRFHRQRMELIL